MLVIYVTLPAPEGIALFMTAVSALVIVYILLWYLK
jgi:hypothetical protein